MPVLLSELPESTVGEVLRHKTWTRAEVEILESTGLFEGRHFELIEGELIDKMGKNRWHTLGLARTRRILDTLFGAEYVYTEAPIDIAPVDNPKNEPEPDVYVLRQKLEDLPGNPTFADLALVVEVADSSLRLDLKVKARLYARAGIVEYWVLDLNNRLLHVFRQPENDEYSGRIELAETESIAPLAKPGADIAVSQLLP
ncbi:MAG: Uma2 family endonuclease [Acidobacteria bacterium]|nr:Uma2 family endonuclease [Acidobacteriota bacterium]